jgi:chloramphenicol 3-O-phosphotransferase
MSRPGQIVIVNGTSGSGKSTTTEMFASRSSDYWLRYGIDDFLAATAPAKFGHHGPRAAEGICAVPVDPDRPDGPLRWRFGAHGLRAFAALHEWIAGASRAGCNIVVDHLLLTDPPILRDCVARLADLPVLLVTLKPPFEALEKRVAGRPMTKRMPTDLLGADATAKIIDRLDRLRPWFYESVYANAVADLTIDTNAHAPAQVCEMIEKRLAQGPAEAFSRLRAQWSVN